MLELKTYKNYKELCVAMGCKITDGSSKKKQLKELESLCEYHKEGNKFVIDEVYAIPKEIEDKRKTRVSELSECIQFSILYLLSHAKKNNLIISKNKLMILTGLINDQFYSIMDNKEVYSENRNMQKMIVTETLGKAYSCTNGYLARALRILENKFLIDVNIITYINIKMVYPIFDEITKSCIGSNVVIEEREATLEERNFILECENAVAKEKGFTSKNDIPFYRLGNFKKDVLKLLKKRGINFYYKCYDIAGNTKYIAEEYFMLEDKVNSCIDIINKEIQEKVITSITKKQDKLIKGRADVIRDLCNKTLSLTDEDMPIDVYNELIEKGELPVLAKECVVDMYFSDGFIDNVKIVIKDGVDKNIDDRINWEDEYRIREERVSEELKEIFSELK